MFPPLLSDIVLVCHDGGGFTLLSAHSSPKIKGKRRVRKAQSSLNTVSAAGVGLVAYAPLATQAVPPKLQHVGETQATTMQVTYRQFRTPSSADSVSVHDFPV